MNMSIRWGSRRLHVSGDSIVFGGRRLFAWNNVITIVERLVKRKMTLYIEKLATGDDPSQATILACSAFVMPLSLKKD